MNDSLLIIGAGQFGMMAKEIAKSMHCFEKIDFLDDNSDFAIGKIKDAGNFIQSYRNVSVAIGNPDLRLSLIKELRAIGFEIVSLVSPAAYVSPSATVSYGCIIEPNATLQTASYLSVGCIVSSGAVIRHNAFLEEGCHADCNSVITSNVTVSRTTKIACGEVFT